MNSLQTFDITARIDHLSDGVGCFDPIQVIARMRIAFPQLIEDNRDCLLETYHGIMQKSPGPDMDSALRIAIRDMQERGPKILFKIPLPDGQIIRGTAERYWVLVTSPVEFPEDFRCRFTKFLQSLQLQPVKIA